MAQIGDDCYFFYYSKCSKGATCPFRHQETALGTESVCSLWKEGRCFRPACSFRHMDIQKKRSQIPCFWETQPGGCQKPHCVFLHKVVTRAVPVDAIKESTSILPTADPLDWSTLKMMHPPAVTGQAQRLGQEMVTGVKDVPSPKVEQLVINPFEEESDQESINGTPQKMTKPDRCLDEEPKEITKANLFAKVILLKGKTDTDEINNAVMSPSNDVSMAICDSRVTRIEDNSGFGIKTLEEIQREKALQSLLQNKATSKVIEQPVTSDQLLITDTAAPLTRRVVLTSEFEGSRSIQTRKPLKRTITEVEKETNLFPESPKSSRSSIATSPAGKTHRSIKERLGFKSENVVENENESNDDHIKRLPGTNIEKVTASKGVKNIQRTSDSNSDSDSSARRKVESTSVIHRTLTTVSDVCQKNAASSQPLFESSKIEKPHVIVKSLQEIRQEKKRLHRRETENSNNGAKKSDNKARPALEIYRPPIRSRAGICDDQSTKKTINDKPLAADRQKPAARAEDEPKKSDAWLHVKTFAEIMKEKQEKQQREKKGFGNKSAKILEGKKKKVPTATLR